MVNARRAADVGIIPDRHEMMHAHAAHHVDVIPAHHVAGDHDVVGQHAIVAELCIVTDVTVGHEQVKAADARAPAAELVPMLLIVTPSRISLLSPILQRVGSSRYFFVLRPARR